MKVCILKPRLDCMFKKGHVPDKVGPTPPHRQPFENFVNQVVEEYSFRGDETWVVEKPLWQMSPDDVREIDADITFVPHKENHNFPCGDKKVLYYMQMVIPEYFSVNKTGWLAGATYAPLDPKDGDENAKCFDTLSHRSKVNKSKFDQPKRLYEQFPHRDYILFPCQIPHDETIKYHSKISVEQALNCVISYCEQTNTKLIVKGHPVNPGSMEPLRLLTVSSSVTEYITEGSIFDFIDYAKTVCVVNSGTGFESILMNKPVVMFGNAEYDKVVNKANLENYMEVIHNASYDSTQYRKFVNRWTTIMYNTNDSISFRKLPSLNSF